MSFKYYYRQMHLAYLEEQFFFKKDNQWHLKLPWPWKKNYPITRRQKREARNTIIWTETTLWISFIAFPPIFWDQDLGWISEILLTLGTVSVVSFCSYFFFWSRFIKNI